MFKFLTISYILLTMVAVVVIGRIISNQMHDQTAQLHTRLDSVESKLESRNTEFAEVMQIIGNQVDSWRMDSEALNKYFEPYKRLGR
jgi:cell division protein FtsL